MSTALAVHMTLVANKVRFVKTGRHGIDGSLAEPA
jgi:hypothetical protein